MIFILILVNVVTLYLSFAWWLCVNIQINIKFATICPQKWNRGKGSSINDVTQLLIIFDTCTPHRHTFLPSLVLLSQNPWYPLLLRSWRHLWTAPKVIHGDRWAVVYVVFQLIIFMDIVLEECLRIEILKTFIIWYAKYFKILLQYWFLQNGFYASFKCVCKILSAWRMDTWKLNH